MDISLFASFSGRVNRAKFWLAILIYVVIYMVLFVLAMVLGQGSIMQILGFIVGILIFISSIAVGIKRLHDRNKSGWWLLLFYVVPGILSGIGMFMAIYGAVGGSGSTGILGIVLNVAALAISIWAFVELGCLRGTTGANQYGPDPLAGV